MMTMEPLLLPHLPMVHLGQSVPKFQDMDKENESHGMEQLG